jgi:hypothetical protein
VASHLLQPATAGYRVTWCIAVPATLALSCGCGSVGHFNCSLGGCMLFGPVGLLKGSRLVSCMTVRSVGSLVRLLWPITKFLSVEK